MRHLLVYVVAMSCLGGLTAKRSWGDPVDFNRDVRPILSDHCFHCHGPDAATREAGLRLDQQDQAWGKLDSGHHALVAGHPEKSELYQRITATDRDLKMPPPDGGKPLTKKQIQTLKTWIEQGAKYQQHWAFVAPANPVPPAVKTRDWVRNPIDQFVLARLEAAELQPAPEASSRVLIRRVSFSLTGLPPTLEEVETFVTDRRPGAYERMVDRYLNSPAYGEHMARYWLDLARYADSNGYQYDTERTQWVWRDWVIDAYNRNVPFDKFTIEQIAGDLLPDATDQQKLATAFHRNHAITIEGGIIDEEYRTEYVMDRLVTTSEVWLGLTVGCARCHDHKYDPISMREFYQLYAFFNQVPERGMRGFAPQQKIASPLAKSQQQFLEVQIQKLQQQLDDPTLIDRQYDRWLKQVAASQGGWQTLVPREVKSSGGTTLKKLPDHSVLASGANPRQDIYEVTARTDQTQITAVRLEALTHESLPGGEPGRHANSNFVLSEFELQAISRADSTKRQMVKFSRAQADYSQAGYEIAKAIDGTTAGNNGWAVDGPTRKRPATAIFIAAPPFGFDGGTELRFRLRHEASFRTHGIGRLRLSLTRDSIENLNWQGPPARIRDLARQQIQQPTPANERTLRKYFLEQQDPRQKIEQQIAKLQQAKAAAFPATMIMQDQPQPRATFILERGQYDKPTEKVSADVPGVFPPLPADAPRNRLALAQWLVDDKHPLTARVAVNRYWQRLFGIGLVKTPEDFGLQGELPSHPELLDWLARKFIRSGWDIQQMQRLIVMSATFRQSSHVPAANYREDPENRMLSRGPRLRLDAEEIRDAALSVSGLLVDRLGGPSVYPYQPQGLWLELNNRPGYSKAYPQGQGDDLYRRSLYTFWKRTVPAPMLKTFDAPEREFCTIRRSRTNTPLQALLMLNGTQFVEAARELGTRMLVEGGRDLDEQIRYGFRLVTARRPTLAEQTLLRETYDEELMRFSKDPAAAKRVLKVGGKPYKTNLPETELAAMTSVARLLLNLDEAINRD